MEIVKLDSFLPEDLSSTIEQIVGHHQFPWYWRQSSTYGVRLEGVGYEDFQFIHLIYYQGEPQSEVFEIVKPLLSEFEKVTGHTIKNIRKIKANLLTKQIISEDVLTQSIHTDIDNPQGKFISIVYYVNDSDGDTIIFDGDREITKSPKRGTAICFPSSIKHRATPPSVNSRRMVLNIVVEV